MSPPHMNGAEMKYVRRAFRTNWIAPLGENIDKFEESVRSYVRMPEAVALSSGTAAIHLALKALGVSAGDAVFCSDVTFAGSCNPIMYLGAEPVFIDSDMESWCISPVLLEKALAEYKSRNRLPKAVIVVDLYGLPADYGRILEICRRYGVPVLEDAAEALGSSYKDEKCGSFGDIGALSFNANKIITTSGGGMALLRDRAAAEKIRYWAAQAREKTPHYEHRDIGYNYRLSNVTAGIGRGQMESLDRYVAARRAILERYKEGLRGFPVSFNPLIAGAEPNCWLSVMVIGESCEAGPGDIIEALSEENIESRPFWKPMHSQPAYRGFDFWSEEGSVPVGDYLFGRAVCLPSGSAMSEKTQSRIIGIIKKRLSEKARCAKYGD